MIMQESLTYTLHRLVFALDRAADAMLRDQFNISYSRALALVMLKDQPGITQHQLALTLGHTDPAVSAILLELTKNGYVTTRTSPLHKRKKEVQLTPQGQQLADEAHAYLDEKFTTLLQAANVDGVRYDQLTKQLYATLTSKEV
jgi:DNA-binding MarR family transcriptional regulator